MVQLILIRLEDISPKSNNDDHFQWVVGNIGPVILPHCSLILCEYASDLNDLFSVKYMSIRLYLSLLSILQIVIP